MTAVRTVTYQFNVNGVYTKKMEARRGLRQGDPISPLLFVVIMEYLHRKLKGLRAIPNFNFHSKCEKIQIIDVSFADDLLLFSRGDVMSVKLVMERFNEFSQFTGLFVNLHKCKIYCGGMNGNGEGQLAGITGFAKGPLPFRYLGIPLTSRKLNNA